MWRSVGKPWYYHRAMMNKFVAVVVILLASVSAARFCHGSDSVLVSYYAVGLGAGVAASIVRAREAPSPVWKDAWLCHGAAYVTCAVVMVSLGVQFAFALTYALIPTLFYGSAALIFATSD